MQVRSRLAIAGPLLSFITALLFTVAMQPEALYYYIVARCRICRDVTDGHEGFPPSQNQGTLVEYARLCVAWEPHRLLHHTLTIYRPNSWQPICPISPDFPHRFN